MTEILKNRDYRFPWLYIAVLSVYLIYGCVTLFYGTFGALERSVYTLAGHFSYRFVLDIVFSIITYLGDGLFVFPLIILWFFKDTKEALWLTASILLTFGVVQYLKLEVYADWRRPSQYFAETMPQLQIYLPLGISDTHKHHSFPSGHSAQVAALFFVISAIYRRPYQIISFGSMALLAAFSRVYLVQHFVRDTIAGIAIALIINAILFLVVKKYLFIEKK